jgi:hypothetical protein
MKKQLVFIYYNADSVFFNMAADWLHKIFSPKTYHCSICALTYSHLGERKSWRKFINNLDIESLFLHKDEFNTQFSNQTFDFPCILLNIENQLTEFISADDMNLMTSLEELQDEIVKNLTAKNFKVG